jgi:DNA polymerase IIIc chi subunit
METELTEKQNITLAIPKSLLRKAKVVAAERQTSLSALLTQLLIDLVKQEDQYEQARQRSLALLEQGFHLGTQGKITWSRDELHER